MIVQRIIIACAAGLFTTFGSLHATAPAREIGIEGDLELTLDRGDYQSKPLDDRTPLILRIESIKPAAEGRFVYDFHYMGFEPGSHKLADYLIHPDGSPATEIGDLSFNVRSILPPDHNGALNTYVPRPFPWFGGYRRLLGGLATLWVLGLLAFIWFGRRRKARIVIEEIVPPPSYAERMRPFVEAAAAGKLTASGQAELERLLTGFWREKLAIPEQRMADALAALKRHPEAGALLNAVERWLHRPGGASPVEIKSLLGPYRHLPVAAAKEASA